MPWVVRGEFRKLWIGQAVSASGSAITSVALPLVAVVTLNASPLEMGLLSALTVLPHLLFGLSAGLLVDRVSLRPLLVIADAGRAVVLGAIPLVWALGSLRIEHLYVVAVLAGVLTLLSDTASLTFIPALVPRDELMQANSASMLNQTVASTTGPAVAGFLVQLVSAPFAIAFDALSFVVSGVASYLIKAPPKVAGPPRAKTHVFTGLRVLFGHRLLAPLVLSATIAAVAGAMQAPLVVLYLVRELHWSPALVGVAVTVVGAASVGGTLLATPLTRHFGIGRTYTLGQLLVALSGVTLTIGLAPFIFIAQTMAGLGMPLYGVPQRTLRQSLVPAELLGQATAAWRTLVIGGQTIGAVSGGLIAGPLGLRPTLILSSAGMLAGCLYAALSPLRSLRKLPSHEQIAP